MVDRSGANGINKSAAHTIRVTSAVARGGSASTEEGWVVTRSDETHVTTLLKSAFLHTVNDAENVSPREMGGPQGDAFTEKVFVEPFTAVH
jgi:hypothetical protein